MSNTKNLISVFTLSTLLSACAVGPLVSQETARSVGKANHEFSGGYGVAGYVFKWNYGLTENWDVGLHWESLSVGVRTKYAFINSKDGWSFAGAVGVGNSVGGDHYYADLMGSYMTGSWEPYGTFRYVHVSTDPLDFRDESTGSVDFTVSGFSYEYGQYILGTRYWFNPKWYLSVEASALTSLSSKLKIESDVMAGAAVGARF